MSRGWTWLDESISEEEIEKRTPLLNHLAQQWSSMHDAEEQQRFRRETDREDGYDDYEFDTIEEEQAYQALKKLGRDQQAAQVAFIEKQMKELGARMMRPYEHWNEDERYMQYMECERFGDYPC